jgi:hypothetical protein
MRRMLLACRAVPLWGQAVKVGSQRSDGFNDEADGGQHEGDCFAQGQEDQPTKTSPKSLRSVVLQVPQKAKAMMASNPAMAKATAVQRKPSRVHSQFQHRCESLTFGLRSRLC